MKEVPSQRFLRFLKFNKLLVDSIGFSLYLVMYRLVQLNFTPVIKVFYMMFQRSFTIFIQTAYR